MRNGVGLYYLLNLIFLLIFCVMFPLSKKRLINSLMWVGSYIIKVSKCFGENPHELFYIEKVSIEWLIKFLFVKD
jgi:hypothetical protein